jgi:glycosyltransferase involved in cell wall biosynthesis
VKILMPYAYATLASFAQDDVTILCERHDVEVVPFESFADIFLAAARVARSDALFCWFGSTRYLPAMLVAKVLGKPIIVVAGGYDVADVPSIGYGNMRGGAARVLGRFVFRLATHVLSFSRAAADEAERNAGVPPDRNQVLYLGFDPGRLGANVDPDDKERLVVTVAHLNPISIVRKGILTLVRASRLVPDAQFVIGGHGDPETMRVLASEAGGNVVFTGAMTNEARDALLQRAKVYCQPSVHEGFGAAVAEAMLFNCIPVVSRRGSLPEVTGPHARFVEPEDPVALAATIRAALNDALGAGETPRAYVARTFPLSRRREGLFRQLDELRDHSHRTRS